MKVGELYRATPGKTYRILHVGTDTVRYYSEADESQREDSRIQWELDIETGRVILSGMYVGVPERLYHNPEGRARWS